jgi:tryptophan synthase beta chain
MAKDQILVMNLCGRGDKDVHTVAQALEAQDAAKQ